MLLNTSVYSTSHPTISEILSFVVILFGDFFFNSGYKMKKRVGAIEEFEFEPLLSGGPLQLETIKKQLHIAIAVTGWIESGMQGKLNHLGYFDYEK